jgi:membrane-associated phospholipid phosphatase
MTHGGVVVWRNLRAMIPLTVVNSAGYLLLNAYPPSAPRVLPLTAVDRAVPFLVWTIWPYVALLLSDLVLPLFLRDQRLFQRALVAYGVAIGLNFLVWATLPTTMLRPEVPGGGSLSEGLYRLLIAVDGAGNCFPSAHVTIPAVAVWALARERPWLRVPLWTLLAMASLSILTTKQHYLVDLVGGFATAALGVGASGWLLALVGRADPATRRRGAEPEA